MFAESRPGGPFPVDASSVLVDRGSGGGGYWVSGVPLKVPKNSLLLCCFPISCRLFVQYLFSYYD